MSDRHFTIGDALVALIYFIAHNPIAWVLIGGLILAIAHHSSACP